MKPRTPSTSSLGQGKGMSQADPGSQARRPWSAPRIELLDLASSTRGGPLTNASKKENAVYRPS